MNAYEKAVLMQYYVAQGGRCYECARVFSFYPRSIDTNRSVCYCRDCRFEKLIMMAILLHSTDGGCVH